MKQNINLSEPDLNIVKALKEIKWPLKNYEGILIHLDENRFNHVSVKRHFLKVRDIKLVPNILKSPIKIVDKDYRGDKLYFGKRKGTTGNNNMPYLQIVTKVVRSKEYIITIYPRKVLSEKNPH